MCVSSPIDADLGPVPRQVAIEGFINVLRQTHAAGTPQPIPALHLFRLLYPEGRFLSVCGYVVRQGVLDL